MIAVISPAKSLDFDSPLPDVQTSENRFPELENLSAAAAERRIEAVLNGAPEIETLAARRRAEAALRSYAQMAHAMPVEVFSEQAETLGFDMEALAYAFEVGVDAVCRRLASLPPAAGRGLRAVVLRGCAH